MVWMQVILSGNLFSQVKDSIIYVDTSNIEQVAVQEDTIVFTSMEDSHSPVKAALYSSVLPGLGQGYNRKYWKIPIVYASLATSGYFVWWFNHYYNEFRMAFLQYQKYGNEDYIVDNFDLPNYIPGRSVDIQLSEGRDYYRRYRDLNAIMFIGIYMLNIVDATVDAHFFNFDVSNELSVNFEPMHLASVYGVNGYGLKLCLNF